MNSSFSITSDSLLQTLLDLVIRKQLHTVSLEFTEMREKDSETLLLVEIVFRDPEQKDTCYQEIAKSIAITREKTLKNRD